MGRSLPAAALLACAAVAHGHWEKGMGLRDAHRHGPGARIRYLRETAVTVFCQKTQRNPNW